MKKRLCCLAAVLSCVVTLAVGVSAVNIKDSGTCGEDLTWTLYDDGELVIEGTGEMESHSGLFDVAPWYMYRSSITKATIAEGVSSIGDNAFYACSQLTDVSIPDSITIIGEEAFRDCFALPSLAISSGVISIGSNAWVNCYSLTEITVDGENPEYESDSCGVLYNKGKTVIIRFPVANPATFYVIPDGVQRIGDNAFEKCGGLTSVSIPNTVTIIGDDAFSGCDDLTSVIIPEDVTIIGNDAFAACAALSSVELPYGVMSIGDEAFGNCVSLTSIVIPDSVTTLGNGAFASCENLTSVTIGNGITAIGERTFYYCGSLTDVTIGSSVTTIGYYAFFHCNSLTNIVIPDSVVSVGESAFCGCTSLNRVTIGNGVTTIGDSSFKNCPGLTDVRIPDSVTTIDNDAFKECTGLKNVSFGSGVTTIGSQAFYGCVGLTNVVIPAGVTSIGLYAFLCNNLASVTLLSKTVTIESRAFLPKRRVIMLYGYPDSTAEAYANRYSSIATFIPLDETEPPVITFALSSVTGSTGDTVSIQLTASSTVPVNSLELRLLPYDTAALTFVGFDNYGEIGENCSVCVFDDTSGVIQLTLTETAVLDNAYICDLRFTINNDAESGTAEIGMISHVKGSSEKVAYDETFCDITVNGYILGDISGDGAVDIDDVLALFKYSMLPDIYPVDYPGNMDYTGDGLVDIADVLVLFKYSMLPDVYPIA